MKKILILLTFMFVLFASVSFVCAAADTTVNDTDKNSTGIASTSSPTPSGSSAPAASSAPVGNSSPGIAPASISLGADKIVTVTYTKPVHGKPITFTITAKWKVNNTPVANWRPAFLLTADSDKSSPKEGHFVTSDPTNANGVLTITWKGNGGWFDYYNLIICDYAEMINGSSMPSGNPLNASYNTIYYNKTKLLDFTIKSNSTVMILNITKSTIYEGMYTQVTAYVTSNGNPITVGYLIWDYGADKPVATILRNGMSVFNYTSYKLGNNLISVKYVSVGGDSMAIFPGLVISSVMPSKSFNILVKPAPNLVIAKVVRAGNKYKVTIKNIGKGASSATKLTLGYGKKNSKTINVRALGAGKSKTYTVNFFKYNKHKKYKKYAWINPNQTVHDKDYTNDKLTFKSNVAYGLAADLRIDNVTRSGDNYLITIRNYGNLASSAFKLQMWFGTKKKQKGPIDHNIKSFGQLGKKLPPGAAITLTVPYYKYKSHAKFFKFVKVNGNKKVPELNYANNLKKFKVVPKVKI